MLANERNEIILTQLRQKKAVSVSALASEFGVAPETVRRDLAALEKAGKLLRVHGGAVAPNEKERYVRLPALDERVRIRTDEKRALSETAAALVAEDDVLALDSGSTPLLFAEILAETFRALTVISYSLDIVNYLTAHSSFRVIGIGGYYLPSERLFCGFPAAEAIGRMHAAKAFIAPTAVSLRQGVTITVPEIYPLHRAMLEMANEAYVLADASKFESAGAIRLCAANEVTGIVTDPGIDDATVKMYTEQGIRLLR